MTTYSYSAVSAGGKTAKGNIEAANQPEALERIRAMGFFPMKVTAQAAPSSPAERVRRHAGRLSLKSRAAMVPTRPRGRIKARQLAVFTRQLATLLEAGLPLLRGLRLLHEQEENRRFKPYIAGLAESIEGGASFSEALAQHPAVFDRLYVNLAKAGEMSGTLEDALKRLANFMEKTGRIKARVKTALFYPAAVMTVAIGVVALMLLVIVPRFESVFADLTGGQSLPQFTRFVLGIANGVREHFVSFAAIGVGLWLAFSAALRTVTGRRIFDQFKLRVPLFGPVFRKLAVARFTRTLGTLLTSGVPVLPALSIVRETAGNVVLGRLAESVRTNVEQGESIAGPLRGSGVFPAMVVGMVDVGEQTGALPEMLTRIADNYEEEADNAVAAMTSLLEPLLIVFLAVVVGSIVIAMFLPIIKLMDPSGLGSQAGQM